MKKIVLINVDFKDVYTGKLHRAGETAEMTDGRIAEIKAVSPDFVTVIGEVEEPTSSGATPEAPQAPDATKPTEAKAPKSKK